MEVALNAGNNFKRGFGFVSIGKSRGFTLIELMIALVITAILIALATPSYQNTIQKRRVTSAAESIASLLALAQGEAIKRNELVAVSIMRESGTSWCVGAMILPPRRPQIHPPVPAPPRRRRPPPP